MQVSARFRDHTRTVKQRILHIGKVLQRRTREAQADVEKATTDILRIARRVVTGARAVAHQVAESLGETHTTTAKTARRLAGRWRQVADLTATVIQQTQQVLGGNRHIPYRIVSLYDPDARPIRKRNLKAPTEFGYKVLIQETEERLVTGCEVCKGNPRDDSLLPAAVDRREKVFKRPPRDAATDRGFATATNERLLKERG